MGENYRKDMRKSFSPLFLKLGKYGWGHNSTEVVERGACG